jgi:hypothetical protein
MIPHALPDASIPPSLVIGAFEDSHAALPMAPRLVVRPSSPPTWLFALLAVSTAGLAGVGYAFIADAGPFKGASKNADAVLERPRRVESPSPSFVETGAALPVIATAAAETVAPIATSPTEVGAPLVLSASPPVAIASASSETVPRASLPLAPSADESALLSFQGYLIVHSTVGADVVVQGVAAGKTNEPLLVRCGPRNVRLRNGAQWISEGQHVHIDCMRSTEVTIASGPPTDR